eukprot:TRINITY_DN37127_c0_g1_i1.p1 TRINITY_DN37127_c0_g1~~TRINITY_DN37127_c0_g1_i1.p1  ORF type:complete len:283 (+),score=47.67 TRINITY_DN37127_c0_g1_i1:51-899(+)
MGVMLAEAGSSAKKIEKEMKIHDVLIVMDMQNDMMEGGPMEVAESESVIPEVVRLIGHASQVGAKIIAVRAYHPANHCSFIGRRAAFPRHCLQGTTGSYFCDEIGEALTQAMQRAQERKESNVHICFKGLCDQISSNGAIPYAPQFALQRLTMSDPSKPMIDWSGAFELKCSNLAADVNAHPDIRSILRKVPIKEILWGAPEGSRIFICGLPFDFGVIDTACCAHLMGKSGIHIVFDATRPFYFPGEGIGKGGFLSSATEIHQMLAQHDIRLCYCSDVVRSS